jgi:hypothetical protein
MNIIILSIKVPHNNAYFFKTLLITEKRMHRKYTTVSGPRPGLALQLMSSHGLPGALHVPTLCTVCPGSWCLGRR